jgi:hypothetical protein
MKQDNIIQHLHHSGTTLPQVCPCDTPNELDNKLHWMAEELHHVTGCRRFRIYKHIVVVTKNGRFLDTRKFLAFVGAYTTVPKAPHSKPIDRTPSKYIDVVHLDIAFGDCMSVGGFKYALIFLDRALQYDWCFGLKSLHQEDILAGFLAFCSKAGCLAKQFCYDCDEKLFGSNICSFLHTNHSSIVACPAIRQSANGVVELHWKIMVHVSRAYLTEKQMPRLFWYYAIKHSAQMMNMIPGKYCGKLALPFMLIHGVSPDTRTWLPLFLICYLHHEKDSNASRSKNQAHTLDGILIG